MRERGSSIHLADQPGDARHHEPIEVGQPESGLGDEPVDCAIHVAADADALLQRVKAILPFRNPRAVTAAVL